MSYLPHSPSVSRLPDDRLVQLVLSGDDTAADEFLNRYLGLIYSVLFRMCGLTEDHIPEALHYVLVELFSEDCRRLGAWRGESALTTFLLAEARCLGRKYRDQMYCRGEGMEGLAPGKTACSSDHELPESEGEVIVNRMEKTLREMTDSLEEECRKIMHLRFDKAMSYKETALASGIPVSTVESRLHHCLETLARKMKKSFPDLFEDRFGFDM